MGMQLAPALPRVARTFCLHLRMSISLRHIPTSAYHLAPLLRGRCVRAAPPIVVDDVVAVPAVPTYPAIPPANFTRAIAECLDDDLVGQQRDNISHIVTVIAHIDIVTSRSSSILMLPSAISISCA